MGRGGRREDLVLKSPIDSAGEAWMWRDGWTGKGRLKSQIENAREDSIGSGGRRLEGGLKSLMENAGDEEEERLQIADWKRRGGIDGGRLMEGEGGLKSHIENARGEVMWRGRWRKTVD